MKQPLKMHRPSSVIAAVLMILSQVLHIAAWLSSSGTYASPLFTAELFGNAFTTVMLSVILFRGRKDTVAGVVILLAVIAPALSAAYHMLLVLKIVKTLYVLLCGVSGLVLAAFRVVSAAECLTEGKVSAGGGRVVLWILPVLCFGVELWAQMLLGISNGMNIGEAVTSGLIYIIPQWLGPILMGASFSVPEKRKDS